ncbi:unnamed protein product [Ranitomeya imitator]|uniref:Uncharacterized protein n=1 Tax=Ranitomeya imitator TaxID=111125 RepID=A0ABN9MGM5_9NEOB|nr:unnamed protein product [Ranitomeya imitator]
MTDKVSRHPSNMPVEERSACARPVSPHSDMDSSLDGIITADMIKEEEKLEEAAKVEEQKMMEKEIRKKEKLEKKKQKLAEKSVKASSDAGKTARKRKLKENYSISDVMSKEDVLASRNFTAEELEQNKDSNSVIKDRLSQSVRQTAQHLFDPVRKVDGQPVPYQQPKYFTGGVMRCYQIEGMEWLRMLWENGDQWHIGG